MKNMKVWVWVCKSMLIECCMLCVQSLAGEFPFLTVESLVDPYQMVKKTLRLKDWKIYAGKPCALCSCDVCACDGSPCALCAYGVCLCVVCLCIVCLCMQHVCPASFLCQLC
jgi:hypothetical protein